MKNSAIVLGGVAKADEYTQVIYLVEYCGMFGFENADGDVLKMWDADEYTDRKFKGWLKKFMNRYCNNVQILDGRTPKQRRFDYLYA